MITDIDEIYKRAKIGMFLRHYDNGSIDKRECRSLITRIEMCHNKSGRCPKYCKKIYSENSPSGCYDFGNIDGIVIISLEEEDFLTERDFEI